MVKEYNEKIKSMGIDIGEAREREGYANIDALNNRLAIEQLVDICIFNGQEIARLHDKIDFLMKRNNEE